MKVVGVGPFVGSFEFEVLSFRPYARWLGRVLDCEDLYISSQYDRQFLYNWLPTTNFLPLYLDKFGHKNIIHKSIDHKKFLKYIRNFKNKIYHINDVDKENIHIYSVPYTKFGDPISIYKKVFERIDVPIDEYYKNTVLFIDCDPIAEKVELDDSIAVYSEAYTAETLTRLISSCAITVCPLGFLTALANLQKCKVFSWGTEHPGMYREGGIYNFKNPHCKVIYCDNREEIVVRSINNYLAGIL